MSFRDFVATILVLAVMVFVVNGTVYAQDSEGDSETAGMNETPPLPDEEIGEAVVDPSLFLDEKIEPELYTIELVPEPAEPVEPAEAEEALREDALLSNGIPVQGRLTNESGVPLNANFSIRFALYTVSSGGTALCVDTDVVAVVNGLFSAVVNSCTASDISGQQLYLGIKVGTDPEMTPRQPVYATAYAHSLRPGAIIHNTGTGHALEARSTGGGVAGSALWAENTGTSGIALWARAQGHRISLPITRLDRPQHLCQA